MDMRTGKGSISPAAADQEADVVIRTDRDNLVAMFTGQNKPTVSFLLGGMEVKGNMSSAMMLEKIARHADTKSSL